MICLSLTFRLVRDSPGYVDWTDRYDAIFSRIVRSFKLEVGSERVQLNSNSHIYGYIGMIIAYTLGGPTDGYIFLIFSDILNLLIF